VSFGPSLRRFAAMRHHRRRICVAVLERANRLSGFLPLFSTDDAKRRWAVDVTSLIVAQHALSGSRQSEEANLFLYHSTGTSWYTGDAMGLKTEAFGHRDTIPLRQTPSTHCIGSAWAPAAMILSAGGQGPRAALPRLNRVAPAPLRRRVRPVTSRIQGPGGAAQQNAPCSTCSRRNTAAARGNSAKDSIRMTTLPRRPRPWSTA